MSPTTVRGSTMWSWVRSTAAAFIIVFILFAEGQSAYAHTGFGSSDPADQEVLAEAVSEILLVFTGEATPVGEGFVVLDAAGNLRVPDVVSSEDNLTWVLGFEEPLAGGTVGVRWSVQAPDAHPINGSFSFTVEAEPPPTSIAASPLPEAETQVAVPPETGVPATSAPSIPQTVPAGIATADEPISLDDFLDTSEAQVGGASAVGALGRIIGLVGAVVGIGGLVFAAYVVADQPGDIRSVLFWVRRAGVMLVIGSIVQLVSQVASSGGRWSALWSTGALGDVVDSSFGLAIGLRIAGGILIAARPRTGALIGVVVVLASFLFDGHTVTEGVRWIHAVVNVVHVAAGSVWAGGLFMLGHVVWRRHRAGVEGQTLQLAVKFSVAATVAVVVAGFAGLVLAVIILDSVSELWSTPWGNALIAKVVLVAVAAAAGGYNHKVLIPEMSSSRDDQFAETRFRNVVTAEALALAFVIVATGFLVAAAS